MVKMPEGAEALEVSLPVVTGRESSKPPPGVDGKLLTGKGVSVAEIGEPEGTAATDCSNPETLERQG
jgi:hypothetical protein